MKTILFLNLDLISAIRWLLDQINRFSLLLIVKIILMHALLVLFCFVLILLLLLRTFFLNYINFFKTLRYLLRLLNVTGYVSNNDLDLP